MVKALVSSVIVLALLGTACAESTSSPVPAVEQFTPAATEPVGAATVEPTPLQMTDTPAVAPTLQEATAAPAAEVTEATLPGTSQSGAAETFRIVPGESSVQYEVGETFFNDNNRFNIAIGKTTEISGTIQIDRQNPQNSSIGVLEVNIEDFTSDSPRRDNTIRDRFLESGRFPVARFVPTAIQNLPAAYTEGQEVSFQVTGDLTVRETTRPATFDVTAVLSGSELRGRAATTLKMSDFGVGPIEMAGILGTEDDVKVTFDFLARPGE